MSHLKALKRENRWHHHLRTQLQPYQSVLCCCGYDITRINNNLCRAPILHINEVWVSVMDVRGQLNTCHGCCSCLWLNCRRLCEQRVHLDYIILVKVPFKTEEYTRQKSNLPLLLGDWEPSPDDKRTHFLVFVKKCAAVESSPGLTELDDHMTSVFEERSRLALRLVWTPSGPVSRLMRLGFHGYRPHPAVLDQEGGTTPESENLKVYIKLSHLPDLTLECEETRVFQEKLFQVNNWVITC